jgi:hypothetical protein
VDSEADDGCSHILGLYFVALIMILTGASQSLRRISSSMPARYCAALASVGFILFSAIAANSGIA